MPESMSDGFGLDHLPSGVYSVGAGPLMAVATDLNQDGKPDLAVTSYRTDSVSVLINVSR